MPVSLTGTVTKEEFRDIVEETAKSFTIDNEASADLSEDGLFVLVQTHTSLSHEQQTTLSELCHLQANWLEPAHYWKHEGLPRRSSSEAFGTEHHSTTNVSIAQQPPPPPPPPPPSGPLLDPPQPVPPNTFEVRGIPKGCSKDEVQAQLKAAGISESDVDVDVRSLAVYNQRYSCATFIVRQAKLRKENFTCLPKGWRIDDDFSGITPLHDGGDDAEVDIVAVPGLGTRAMWTFRPRDQADMWLRDFLLQDLPNCRVLLYGYKSTVPRSNDTAQAHDFADTLRNLLLTFRSATNARDRPVIFIGHSLGGIIIKQLLHQIEGNPEAEMLYRACRGFLFFGVPNLGLDNEKLELMTENQPNKPLISSLLVEQDGQPSSYLNLLDDTFARALRRLPIMPEVIAFYETIRTRMTGQDEAGGWVRHKGKPVLMVPQQSANLPLLGCTAERLDGADHSNLVKFTDRKGNYEIVLGKLLSMVKKIVSSKQQAE